MASQNVRSSFYFWVFFFIMCYYENLLERLPNMIFIFVVILLYIKSQDNLFLDLCFYITKQFILMNYKIVVKQVLIVYENGA